MLQLLTKSYLKIVHGLLNISHRDVHTCPMNSQEAHDSNIVL